MFSFLSSSARLKRNVAAAFVTLLSLGSLTAHAQTAPGQQVQPSHYYLNGKPSTQAAVEQLDKNIIASVDVLKGQQAIDYTHDAKATGVVLVQTK